MFFVTGELTWTKPQQESHIYILQGIGFRVEVRTLWHHLLTRSWKNDFTSLFNIYIEARTGGAAEQIELGAVWGRTVFGKPVSLLTKTCHPDNHKELKWILCELNLKEPLSFTLLTDRPCCLFSDRTPSTDLCLGLWAWEASTLLEGGIFSLLLCRSAALELKFVFKQGDRERWSWKCTNAK